MYFYSERPGTLAAKKYEDDIPEPVKRRRLAEIVEKQNFVSKQKNKMRIGQKFNVLIEGISKKNKNEYKGRTDQNIIVVFPMENYKQGEYVEVIVEDTTTTTLKGKVLKAIKLPEIN
jgi:tRNA-2-methylthio-N6-dimethylallyladenosine synthase